MLRVVKPSPLRLWGFLLTVLGGAMIAFGSIGGWAAISLGNSVENAIPTKGIDVWQGKATLTLGALIVVGILALRMVRAERRGAVATAIIALADAALVLTVWSLISLASVAGDTGVAAITAAAQRSGMSADEADRVVSQLLDRFGIQAEAQPGLWIVVVGTLLAVTGGVIDLLWVRRKREAGDAIDPDIALEARTEPPVVG